LGFAREVAEHIKSDHHEVRLTRQEFFEVLPRLIWHEDEPLVWQSSISLYCVARLAREHVTVVLTGEGSDETLAGYYRYPWTLLNSKMDRAYRAITPTALRRLMRNNVAGSLLNVSAKLRRKLEHTFLFRNGDSWPSFYFDNFYSAFSSADQAELMTREISAVAGDPYAGSQRHWERSQGSLLHRMLYTDINTYLVELCMKQDQMSMAASIESRVPFLDHVLVEFAARIPAEYQIRGMAGKLILKQAVKELLPASIVWRKKMGFPTPWDFWLAGPQLDEIERTLLEPRSTARGLFKPDVVKQVFAQHRAKHRDHGNRIWRLLNLELWQRVFVDRDQAGLNQPAAAYSDAPV
jgi:asparagine synthase (glutamine-hydrolysing)